MKTLLSYVILFALVMIVSQGTSQNTYRINDTTYVCYTFEQNREIAVLISNGDMDKHIVYLQGEQIDAMNNVIETYKNDSTNYESFRRDLITSLNDATNKVNTLTIDNETKTTKIRKKNAWIGGLAGGNAVLLTVLILIIAL